MLRDRARRAPDLGIPDKDDDLAGAGACTKLHFEPGPIVSLRDHGGVQQFHDVGDHVGCAPDMAEHSCSHVAEHVIELITAPQPHRKQELFWIGHRPDPTAKGG